MKALLSGFLTAALASCFAPPSDAAEATWKTTQHWQITGNYAGYCRAQADFPADGTLISIGVTKEGWSIYFGNPSAIPMAIGQPYTVNVSTETGATGTLTGKAIGPTLLSFPGLSLESVMIFAKSKSLKVGNFGTYNLAGSAEAIKETFECFKAVTATGSSAPAPVVHIEEREA